MTTRTDSIKEFLDAVDGFVDAGYRLLSAWENVEAQGMEVVCLEHFPFSESLEEVMAKVVNFQNTVYVKTNEPVG